MPYEISTFTLPCGARAVRTDAIGDIGTEDVNYLLGQLGWGKPLSGIPMLFTTARLKSLSADARKFFANNTDPNVSKVWCATVVSNPVIRVAINFMNRLNPNPRVKNFGTEEAAVRWL